MNGLSFPNVDEITIMSLSPFRSLIDLPKLTRIHFKEYQCRKARFLSLQSTCKVDSSFDLPSLKKIELYGNAFVDLIELSLARRVYWNTSSELPALNSMWIGEHALKNIQRIVINGRSWLEFWVDVPFKNGRLSYSMSSYFDVKLFYHDEGEIGLNEWCIVSSDIVRKWSSIGFV